MLAFFVITVSLGLASCASDVRIRVGKDAHFAREVNKRRVKSDQNGAEIHEHREVANQSLVALKTVADRLGRQTDQGELHDQAERSVDSVSAEEALAKYCNQEDPCDERTKQGISNLLLANWNNQPNFRTKEHSRSLRAMALLEEERTNTSKPRHREPTVDASSAESETGSIDPKALESDCAAKGCPPNQLVMTPAKSGGGGAMTKIFKVYSQVQEKIKFLRTGDGGLAIALGCMAGGPDNCLCKLVYLFYSFPQEDDFPFLPRGCWIDFMYELGNGAQHAFSMMRWPLLLLMSIVLHYNMS